MSDPLTWTGARARVLRILVDAEEPLWALAVARSTGIPYSTVYGTFRALRDMGWAVGVTETVHPSRLARVLYRLTDEGRRQTVALRDKKEK